MRIQKGMSSYKNLDNASLQIYVLRNSAAQWMVKGSGSFFC